MKASLLLSAIILIASAGLWWRDYSATLILREEVHVIQSRIAEAGGGRESGSTDESMVKPAADQTDARDFAIDLIDFFLKAEAGRAAGSPRDEPEQLRILNRLLTQDGPSLKVIIHEALQSGLTAGQKGSLTGPLLALLAKKDPEGALQIFGDYPELSATEPPGEGTRAAECLDALAAKNPDAAIAWLADPAHAKFATAEACAAALAGMIRHSSPTAMKWLLSLPAGATGDDASSVRGIGSNGAPEDRENALAAITDYLPDPQATPVEQAVARQRAESLRQALLSGIAGGLVKGEFPDSAAWLRDNSLTPADRTVLLSELSGQIAHANGGTRPDEWLAWLGAESRNDPARLLSLTNGIVEVWTKRDFNAVGEWLNAQPDGSLRTEATRSFVRTLKDHEPGAAANWAMTLPDSPERTELLEDVVREWNRKDAPAAEAFAAAQGL